MRFYIRKDVFMRKNKTALFLAAVSLSAFFAVSSPGAQEDASRFVDGTRINSVGVGGLTPEEARERIQGFYAGEYELSVIKKDGSREVIRGEAIDYQVALTDDLDAILKAQNEGGRQSGPSVDNSHQAALVPSYSQEKLDQAIEALSVLNSSAVTVTKDASISPYEEGKPFSIVPAVQGNDVDREKTILAVNEAVKAGRNELDLEAEGCYRTVSLWESDEHLKNLCDAMNSRREKKLRYVFGEAEEFLTGETMASWITGVSEGKITVDQEKVAAFVKDLASRYDTAGTARTVTKAAGGQAEITGPYGWKIDQAAETAALMELVSSGSCWSEGQAQADREPVYSQKAASREGTDWGTTYVEVDLGGQHVYMFKEGQIVWDAPCVTGNVSKDYTTPSGIYSLTYKEKDRILRGKKKPDGTYEYESHVDYWMPFNGGIGLHDASWRSKFGGTLYQTGGSHGCINLPPQKAPALYDLVYKGIPVLCTP